MIINAYILKNCLHGYYYYYISLYSFIDLIVYYGLIEYKILF